MAVVNTNVNATVAQNALVRNERQMNTAMLPLGLNTCHVVVPFAEVGDAGALQARPGVAASAAESQNASRKASAGASLPSPY